MEIKGNSRFAAGVVGLILAGGVHAQGASVTLYGLVDTGVEYLSHAGPGGSGSQYRLSSGNVAGSRWGLRGKEDLGNGLSGLFVLEGGILSDTGMTGQGGRLFGRQAYVGLEGKWGRVSLGRHINTLFDVFVPFDPLRYATYGVTAQDAQFANRVDNSVKYTGNFGNLTVIGLYSAGYDSTIANGGEVPGSVRIGQELGGAASYTMGNLGVAVSYDQRRGITVATQGNIERRYAAGLLWSTGPFSAMAGYRFLQGTIAAPTLRSSLYWIGGSYKIQPALTLAAGVYRNDQRQSSNGAMSYALSAIYAVSKRTEVYLNAAFMDNRGTSTSGVALGGSVAPGVNQTGVVGGVKHIF
ncbi:porin [Cupriavidus sp. L7L]|uniref:porin n=1 Tax=Cupriavidus sp. L7L TaxID=2546443 RepID=UPI00105661AC|nr:porin [Cupriavidus sp. L7L]TDF64934.1 porin [Cupriavidus sp. L7L]